MARKPARAASPIAPIRDLFTASERRLLETSFGTGLARATQAELESATRQARILRDKWRGLSAKQGRATKRVAGAASTANARSQEKAGAFGDAVARLERRLAELDRPDLADLRRGAGRKHDSNRCGQRGP